MATETPEQQMSAHLRHAAASAAASAAGGRQFNGHPEHGARATGRRTSKEIANHGGKAPGIKGPTRSWRSRLVIRQEDEIAQLRADRGYVLYLNTKDGILPNLLATSLKSKKIQEEDKSKLDKSL